MTTIAETTELVQDNLKNPIMLAVLLLKENPNIIRCNNNLYLFNGKCYDLLTDKDLDAMFLNFCIKYVATKAWAQISMVIRAFWSYKEIKTIEALNAHEGLLCLNNGILNIYTREFISHSPSYYFDSVLPVDYDAKAGDCPNFLSYLNHTFNGDQDTIDNIIRLGGYLLDTSCAAKKMFMFNGPGGSGKSTLIDTYSMFFIESMDEKNQVTGLSLEDLAGNGFDKAILINSRFNPCAETKKGYIDAEEIKKIISGDITKVRQVYSIAVNFRPKAKIIVACNGLPRFNDTSDGIYRRLCIIEFENQYKSPTEISKIKNASLRRIFPWDTTLMDKIRAERAAILNLFIDGLVELKQNKYEFIDSAASYESINNFKRDSDAVREFLEDNYEIDEESEMPTQKVYDSFKLWHRSNVQETGAMKFRSAEMGKRIHEVFGVKSKGQRKFWDENFKKYVFLSVYPLKEKVIDADVEEIMTEEQAKQRNLEF